MKILQVTKYYHPAVAFGGPVQCSRNLTKYLVKRGHEVTVYATDALNPRSNARIPQRVRTIDGAEVHFFPNIARPFELFISPGILPALRKSIKDYEIIHLHEYRTFQNIAFLLCHTRRNQYVLQTHGLRLPEYAILERNAARVGMRSAYHHAFGKRLLGGASRLIALTEFEKVLLERIGADSRRIAVIPNGVSPDDFVASSSAGHFFRERFGIADDERIVLYVGRLHRSKGIDTLVRAFHLLCKDRADVRLVIAGPDYGYLNELRAMVNNLNIGRKVLFAGFLSHEEKVQAYSSADVVVYPGICEGLPLVPLEAAIMNRPVIVSNDPGMDLVRREGFGLVFHYGKEHELERALARVLLDRDLASRLGATGKKRVLESYTLDVGARRIEELYEEILLRPFSGADTCDQAHHRQ